MNKSVLVLFVFGLSMKCALAQTEALIQPSLRLVNEAPSVAAWTITITPASSTNPSDNSNSSNAKGPRLLKEIQVTKINKDRREVYLWSDGQMSERWVYQGFLLLSQPGDSHITVIGLAVLAQLNPELFSSDFPELKCISPANFAGVRNYAQISCFFFDSSRSPSPIKGDNNLTANATNASSAIGNSPQQAWIDQKTKLPVAISDATGIKIYTFQAGPSRLVLPADFTQALQNYQKSFLPSHKYDMKF
jgi:hypothetical protein